MKAFSSDNNQAGLLLLNAVFREKTRYKKISQELCGEYSYQTPQKMRRLFFR
jgi:hypothetical protein